MATLFLGFSRLLADDGTLRYNEGDKALSRRNMRSHPGLLTRRLGRVVLLSGLNYVLLCFFLCSVAGVSLAGPASVPAPVLAPTPLRIGLEVLASSHPQMVRGKRLAVVVSPGSLDENLLHSVDRLAKAATIELILTGDPYFREIIPGQAGDLSRDALTNARIKILADPLQRPDAKELAGVELMLIDVQCIGIRYFHYVTILAQLLDVAREASLPVMVLDRPNPIGGHLVAGPLLDVKFRSRYGVYPIPLFYGMTFGELALYFNKMFGLDANLTVIGMDGYHRGSLFRDTGLHWPLLQTHLPTPDSPLFMSITGILGELGFLSTGIGTTRPHQYILAPWIDGELLARKLGKPKLPGVSFLPVSVTPSYGLFQRQSVPGIEIVIQDARRVEPFLTGLAILKSLWELYPQQLPLHQEAVATGLDTIMGTESVRTAIVNGLPLMQIYNDVQKGLREFRENRRRILIYPD